MAAWIASKRMPSAETNRSTKPAARSNNPGKSSSSNSPARTFRQKEVRGNDLFTFYHQLSQSPAFFGAFRNRNGGIDVKHYHSVTAFADSSCELNGSSASQSRSESLSRPSRTIATISSVERPPPFQGISSHSSKSCWRFLDRAARAARPSRKPTTPLSNGAENSLPAPLEGAHSESRDNPRPARAEDGDEASASISSTAMIVCWAMERWLRAAHSFNSS